MRSLKLTATAAILAFLLVMVIDGCKKPKEFFDRINTGSGDENRKTVVKFVGGDQDIILRTRDVTPTVETFVLIELSRDASSVADLNKPLTVKLVKNVTLIADYNSANGTSYVELPQSSYTIEDITNITFAPGEFIKEVKITLNKALLDLSAQYALGYTISAVGEGGAISSSAHNALYAIGIKNKYDGHYRVTGTMVDVTNAAFVGTYPLEWDLVTGGATQVIVYDNDNLGFPGHVFSSVGGTVPNTYYGSFGVVVNFDASDNISSVVNYYGQMSGGNKRSAILDATGINKYNAATKTINVKYIMQQYANLSPAPPGNNRTFFNETWTYLGPR